MNEFEAHESSYDHQHKKRLKEMKQMQRDPNAANKARKAERKADEKSGLITIKPMRLGGTAGSGGGFKKGGFKNAFGGDEKEEVKIKKEEVRPDEYVKVLSEAADAESDTDSEDGEGYYDPRRPTGCFEGCPGRL